MLKHLRYLGLTILYVMAISYAYVIGSDMADKTISLTHALTQPAVLYSSPLPVLG